MASDDDMPPPLEDMTEAIQKIRLAKQASGANTTPPAVQESKKEKKTSPSTTKAGETTNPSKPKAKKKKAGGGGGMFGGLSGGFLDGKPKKSKKKSAPKKVSSSQSNDPKEEKKKEKSNKEEDDIIHFSTPTATKNSLELPEVQEAMRSGEPDNSQWLNDDLFAEIAKDPTFAQKLMDPRIARAMKEFQENAAQAAKKYAADEEIGEFFKKFMGIMGNHVEKMSGKEEEEKKKKEEGYIQFGNRKVDPALVQKWLSTPHIRDALNNPQTSHMLAEIQKNSNVFPKFARHPHIQLLIREGILEIPPQFR